MPDLSDEQRMQAAVGLSSGRPDEDAEQIRRWGTQRAIVLRVVLMLAALAIGAGVGVMLATSRSGARDRGRVPAWQETVGLCCSVVGLCLTLGALVWMIRHGRIRSGWTSPAFALTWRQRRELARQIRGTRPVDPTRIPVLRRLSTEAIRQRPQLWMFGGILLTNTGSTLTSDAPWRWVVGALVAASFVVAFVSMQRTQRSARAFLAAHPAPLMETS